jgi:hypothetical protein
MMKIDQHEVEKHWTEYAILNLDSGNVLDDTYATQGEAEFDALLYPRALVVCYEVFQTKPVQCGELPAT